MTLKGLDELDRRILHELQRDARHVSSRDIAEQVDASPSTVRKRIQRLESEGIITGYHATVDYKKAGYQLFMQMECTAEIPVRRGLCTDALDVAGVVGVRELATGENNVLVTAIGTDSTDLARIARELSDLGLRVSDEDLIQRDVRRPFSEFDPE
ncbi:winged helix-turn-helix transcriptional regulator [Haloferax sp. MBLA0076]|uniref:Winged helix-turn-helix transcriptional regulator n=1 Tax=Haloferax litoreum TaxID=2666140 RepID=A0A6A8GKW9_9EURY|nr:MULTISPECIES: winged helix-turn-helix transcriptional regulator [Haloferax]KAB1190536.1 AsnC family transcriptional regulator [Haloferax sp. CBA1148]MRX23519.1 winged helix-turn-helix transcriptional regulator [Haloferax litoreum]